MSQDSLLDCIVPVGGGCAGRKGLGGELRSGIVANLLSGLVAVGGQGLIPGSGGVESVGHCVA